MKFIAIVAHHDILDVITNGFGCPSRYRLPTLPDIIKHMCLHWPDTVDRAMLDTTPAPSEMKTVRRVGFGVEATTTVFTPEAEVGPKSKIRSQL